MVQADNNTGLLRFITCGRVDDGKSTLIGRLLYDSKAILADALDSLRRASHRRGAREMDLSLLTDGLQAEREQGITIDVAYRFFATGTRKFILGDAPGHEQYTRNMVTAASTADLAVILVDARKGVLTQTRRHTALAHLLGVRHLVMAVNKMDLADWSQRAFDAIRADGLTFARELGIPDLAFVPICALGGDMVVERGKRLGWYHGPTLLQILESAPLSQDDLERPFRFPVQWVCRSRPGQAGDDRAYAGRVESGAVRVGDRVAALPGPARTLVRAIRLGEARLESAQAGQSIALELEDDLDLGRGDLLADPASPPLELKEVEATLCWFAETPVQAGARLLLRAGTRETRALLETLRSRLDIATLRPREAERLVMNDIADVRLRLQTPIAADPYRADRATGAFILIDEANNATVAGGLVR
ncbi:MAG: GTP-binding protein [Holophaga sp.]|jgi:sulfate adenylyltransferase subunit 1